MPKRNGFFKKIGGKVHSKMDIKRCSFWRCLGSGYFNDVYVHKQADAKLLDHSDYEGPWVYKKKRHVSDRENYMNTPERNVRIFKEIHPDIATGLFRNGWLAPYFDGDRPTDHELALGILDVYRRTRRIIIDAFSNNFITVNGRAQCIDVDMALK